MKLSLKKITKYILPVLAGIFIGWLLFHRQTPTNESNKPVSEVKQVTEWTCSMHPQIRKDGPGKCPICAMDLIPVNQNTMVSDPGAIRLTKEAAALANVLTSVVKKQHGEKEVRLYGKLQADERLVKSQVAHIPGRIEKLLVNFTGEPLRQGQPVAEIYSPELITAQQELLETARTKDSQNSLYEAAREKLRQWKLTDEQIASIENSGTIQSTFNVVAGNSGVVTSRLVSQGDYVSQGTVLYEISDLSKIWVLFDAYENDLAFLSTGETVEFTVQSLPGRVFTGKISFIDPVIDPVTRSARVRVETGNPSGTFKPGMFATGTVRAYLPSGPEQIVIPKSAVLWTGKRSLVYVKQPGSEEPVFKVREIELGPLLGEYYAVSDGLKEGEEIVTQGAFSVDAAAQLEGKPSMMNPEPGPVQEKSMPGMNTGGQNSMKQVTVKVAGNCEMCKERIETAAKSVTGVGSAEWSIETKKLNITYDENKTNLDAIEKAIAQSGHDTEKFRAPDDIYKSLPECCLYRSN